MPSVKLDTAILDSTLWADRDAREIFITALLLAEPFDMGPPDSLEQLDVRTGAVMGFEPPPGPYGLVGASGAGIVRRALVELEPGLDALQRLGAPDPMSRTSAHGGRRLIRINRGYLVLNFALYRDKDTTAAARARRYRQNKAAAAQAEAPAWFAAFKAAYPKRAGDQGWMQAQRAGQARIKEGANPEEFVAGARRYRDFIVACGKEGTQFVKQAGTFLGPERHYALPWLAPARGTQETAMDRIRKATGTAVARTTLGETFDHEPR
jgi:hypothetical protein